MVVYDNYLFEKESFYSHTPVARAGRGRGLYLLKGEEKKLTFTDTLGAGETMNTHPVGSTFVTQTSQPHISDGEGNLPAQTCEVGSSTLGPHPFYLLGAMTPQLSPVT